MGDFGYINVDSSNGIPEKIDEVNKTLWKIVNNVKYSGYFEEDKDSYEEAIHNEFGLVMSPLQTWAAEEVRQLSRRKGLTRFSERLGTFPLLRVADEIVESLRSHDVVLVVAPTGSGKSLMAPFISEQLIAKELGEESDLYRKTLMVVPSAEHCGSTVRSIEKFYTNSGFIIDGYLNQYEKVEKSAKEMREDLVEFVATNYSSAVRILTNAKLNLLVLDEMHETNDNVQTALAMAVKMLTSSPFVKKKKVVKAERSLNRLLLMTATIDEKEREKLHNYFVAHDLTFKCLDFTSTVVSTKSITMSCYDDPEMPPQFAKTPLSGAITNVSGSRIEKERDIEEGEPEPQFCMGRVREALEVAMEMATNNLRERMEYGGGRRRGLDMNAIIVILPGLEQIDDLYATVFSLRNYKFQYNGQLMAGFHPVRLTSLVRDDRRITSECQLAGDWQEDARLGRIVLTTNLVASGLTIPNAAFVIDAGMQKLPSEYRMYGLSSLETSWIDGMMIIQRAGRTGRTTNGEYFLPYSAEKVKEMRETSKADMMRHRHFEESHFLICSFHCLDLLHPPPDKLMRELTKSMEIRGLISTDGVFRRDTLLMHHFFPFLPVELARFVIQGCRLGITAHVVYLAAETMSRIKFCAPPAKGRAACGGPSQKKSAVEIYARMMDRMGGIERGQRMEGMPELYKGQGDSVALADMIVSFYWACPDVAYSERLMNQLAYAHHTSFWGGAWSRDGIRGVQKDEKGQVIRESTLYELYTLFVREEGRDAVFRNMVQIRSALNSLGLLKAREEDAKKGPPTIFHHRNNRYLTSLNNFCLNQKGRALLGALLAMNSSRVAVWDIVENSPAYWVYDEESPRSDEHPVQFIYPQSDYTQAENDWNELVGRPVYGRYTNAFKKRHEYRAAIDPITSLQMAYFLNLNGIANLREELNWSSLNLELTGAPSRYSIFFSMARGSAESIDLIRHVLKRGTRMLCVSREKIVIPLLEELIIGLWHHTSAHPERYGMEEEGGEEERRTIYPDDDTDDEWVTQDGASEWNDSLYPYGGDGESDSSSEWRTTRKDSC